MCRTSSRHARGITASRPRVRPSGSSVRVLSSFSPSSSPSSLRLCHCSAAADPRALSPRARRLCTVEGDADAGDRPGLQDLPHVRDDQHWGDGRLCAVRVSPRAVPCVYALCTHDFHFTPLDLRVCRIVTQAHPGDEGPIAGGDGHHLRRGLCGPAEGGHREARTRSVFVCLYGVSCCYRGAYDMRFFVSFYPRRGLSHRGLYPSLANVQRWSTRRTRRRRSGRLITRSEIQPECGVGRRALW